MGQISANNEKNVIRDPLLAGILSFLFMGLGHAYNGQRRKGYLFFASYIVLAILYFILLKLFNEPLPKSSKEIPYTSLSYIITVMLGFAIWIFNIYDAYRSAKRINEGNKIPSSTPGRSSFIFLRTILLSFISIIIILFLITFLSFILNPVNRDLLSARRYSRIGDNKTAIAYYKKLVKRLPQSSGRVLKSHESALYHNMAVALQRNGDYKEALQAYSDALKFAKNNKESAAAHYGIGYIYMIEEQFENALQEYDKAIELDPTMYDAYQNRAVNLRLMGRSQDSVDACLATLRLFPDSGKTYCSLGMAYEMMQRFEEAIKAHIQAIRFNWQFSKKRIDYCFSKLTDKKLAAKLLEELAKVDDGLAQNIRKKYINSSL